ncbi:MAG: ATP-binding protein, partial [Candidatus Margulisiibacteriota bacterium]
LARQRVLETMRRDFIANVSHELKTPLTTIAGFIETLESGALEDAQHNRRFLGIISTNVKRLTLLVQDILNLAKIENEISPRETVNLVDLVRTMLQEHFSAHLTRITFSPSQKPITVLANLREIYSACLNYVDNAIKYAPYGPIDISLTKDAGSIYYRVKDGGPGISPNELSRIFERFYRPDKNRSRETGGTGLGLSIVKNVVEKHGGAVGVESVEGQGTLFYFRLPLQS